jgi:transposase
LPRTAQISKEKQQSIITLRHEGQSIQNISRTLNVSSGAVAKAIKRYDETVYREDCHRNGRPRVTSAAEDTFIRVSSLRNCSQNKCFTEFK